MKTWIYIQWVQKDLSIRIVLKRTPSVLFQLKRLPLVLQLVGSLARLCQKGGEGEIYQRSLPSLPTFLSLENGGRVRAISLPNGLPNSQAKEMRGPRVLPMVAEIVDHSIDITLPKRLTKVQRVQQLKLQNLKSWLTTTSSSGIVEVLEIIERI